MHLKTILLDRVANIPWENLLFSLMRVAGIMIGVWIIILILKGIMKRLELKFKSDREDLKSLEASKRVETIFQLIRQGLNITISSLGVLMILKEFGLDIGPILASAGVLGLAVGFGAQNLVRDIITGFFMILENQVRVGDVVQINGTGGLVEKINLRTIIIRDVTGTVHVFPNGTINTVANMTNQWSAYVFEIGVAYKENADVVIQEIKDILQELKSDVDWGFKMLEEPEVFGLDKLGDSSIVIKGRIKTLPIKQWEVGREFLRRVKKRFDEKGIEIPFPQQTLTPGQGWKELFHVKQS